MKVRDKFVYLYDGRVIRIRQAFDIRCDDRLATFEQACLKRFPFVFQNDLAVGLKFTNWNLYTNTNQMLFLAMGGRKQRFPVKILLSTKKVDTRTSFEE